MLAGPADRRPAQHLSLRLEQPLRGRDRQAAGRCDADQLSDAAGRVGRALSRADRAQGLARPLARVVAGRDARTGRTRRVGPGPGGRARSRARRAGLEPTGASTAHRKVDRDGAGAGIHTDPAWAACRRRAAVDRRARRHAAGDGGIEPWAAAGAGADRRSRRRPEPGAGAEGAGTRAAGRDAGDADRTGGRRCASG